MIFRDLKLNKAVKSGEADDEIKAATFSSASINMVESDNDNDTCDFCPGYLTIFNFPTSISGVAKNIK